MEVGGIEPHTCVVTQELNPCCDQIVSIFLSARIKFDVT